MARKLKQWPPPKGYCDVHFADLFSSDSTEPYIGATTKELFEELLDQPGELFFSVYYDNVDDRLYTCFDGGCSPDEVEETLEQHRGKL